MKSLQAQLLLLIFLIAGGFFTRCKKIELVRIAYVKTEVVTNIQSTSATANGTIIDIGEGGIKDYGFCWSSGNKVPTKNDSFVTNGSTTAKGVYTALITGLTVNSEYYIRSYVVDENGINYGEVKTFLTPVSGGTGYWLKYDDGFNYTGIGITDGSNFDYAIRFPVSALANYNGFRISKVRFFPTDQAQFHVEVFEGSGTPSLVYYEQVYNPTLNAWNEYSPSFTYYINSSMEVWIGIWVTNYSAGIYPAGVDEGPAVSGFGDMVSFDDGASWESLFAGNPALNYNWNLEVFVTNLKGAEVKLTSDAGFRNKVKPVSAFKGSVEKLVAEKEIN